MFKILVTCPEYLSEKSIDILNTCGTVICKNLSPQDLMKEIIDVDAIFVRVDTQLNKEFLEKAKKLKVIGSATTGTNHIDTKYAKETGIKIINLDGIHTIATAEYTIALMLSLLRNIPFASKSLCDGNWDRIKFLGAEIYGKTLGIIGLGRIGKEVAKYATSFGMNIIAFDPYVNESEAEKINTRMVPLEELLKSSDIITLHAALTDETKHMIDKNELRLMKPTAFLINVARGNLINEDALLESLRKKLISGAACDVFTKEPLNPKNKLIQYTKDHHNLLLTPHIAATTKESVERSSVYIAEKIKEFLIK